jgi:hypothetical protein
MGTSKFFKSNAHPTIMTEKLTCPVCDRTEIETNTCPNCETDLSTIRMLKELSFLDNKTEVKPVKASLVYLVLGIALLTIITGIYGGYSIANNQYQASLDKINQEKNSPVIVENTEIKTKPKLNWCGGFKYQIKSGDSLYMLGLRFYGDGSAWNLITEANPSITSPQNLEVGQIILIPNLTEFCQ